MDAHGVPSFQMGGVRLVVAFVVGVALLATMPACSSRDEKTTQPSEDNVALTEPPRVPDPPPRYKHDDVGDSGVVLPDGGSGQTLQIKCGGYTPYVCSMDDGSFKCSDRPCMPDCSRLGCLGGEVCLACDGGYRCVASGDSC